MGDGAEATHGLGLRNSLGRRRTQRKAYKSLGSICHLREEDNLLCQKLLSDTKSIWMKDIERTPEWFAAYTESTYGTIVGVTAILVRRARCFEIF